MPERIFTLRELTRLLRLTPKRLTQLRRLGLLHEEGTGYRFRELVAARAAAALLESGATVRQVREALQGARRLAPNAAEPLSELRLHVERNRVVVEQDHLRFDPRTGQALLDFQMGDLERETRESLLTGVLRPLIPPADAAEAWFARASEWDNDPTHWDSAVNAYERVLAIDPGYAAAWNNLGLHEDLGDFTAAIAWYRRALELTPDYADAHFNLAGVLAKTGRNEVAALHWRRYLELDRASPWAQIARSHLEATESPEPDE